MTDTPTAERFSHEDIVGAIQALIGASQSTDNDIQSIVDLLRVVSSIVDHNISTGALSLPDGWEQTDTSGGE